MAANLCRPNRSPGTCDHRSLRCSTHLSSSCDASCHHYYTLCSSSHLLPSPPTLLCTLALCPLLRCCIARPSSPFPSSPFPFRDVERWRLQPGVPQGAGHEAPDRAGPQAAHQRSATSPTQRFPRACTPSYLSPPPSISDRPSLLFPAPAEYVRQIQEKTQVRPSSALPQHSLSQPACNLCFLYTRLASHPLSHAPLHRPRVVRLQLPRVGCGHVRGAVPGVGRGRSVRDQPRRLRLPPLRVIPLPTRRAVQQRPPTRSSSG